jgi:GNAT superfamily N-acetyltransferase
MASRTDSDPGSDHAAITRHLEAVESAALIDLHAAASADVREVMGLQLESMGGAHASVAERGANIVINRVIGLGIDEPATNEQLNAIRAFYRRAGIERYFVQASPVAKPIPLTVLLEQNGLIRDRGWMKFARGAEPLGEPVTDFSIREVGPEHAKEFGQIVGRAFDLEDSGGQLCACLVGRPGWHVFMSFDGDRPAGTGALYVKDGVGWTDWGATDPAFRRRGSQSALLARRINKAIELGCNLIGTCTGEAVPGDEQHSYGNIKRAGFCEIGVRDNYSLTGRPG